MQDAQNGADVAGLFRLEVEKHPLLVGARRIVHRADGVTELMDGRGTVTGWLAAY